MAVTEEVLRLKTESVGDEQIEKLRTKLKTLQADLAELQSGFDRGAVHLSNFQNQSKILEQQVARTTNELSKLAGSKGGGGGGLSGQGVMGLSFAVQDFLSANGDFVQGLYRIQNNIPVLLSQLGVGAGLAGTISLVSLGIGALLPKIMELGKEFLGSGEKAVSFKSYLQELQKTVDDFNKSQTGTATDVVKAKDAQNQIEILTKGEAAWKEAIRERSKAEKETGSEVVDALNALEAKQSEIITSIAKKQSDAEVARRNQEIQARNQREEDLVRELAAIANADAEGTEMMLETHRKRQGLLQIDAKERVRIEEEIQARIGAIWKNATEGNVEQLEELIKKLKDAGQKEVAVWLEQARDREKIQRENIDQMIKNEEKFAQEYAERERERILNVDIVEQKEAFEQMHADVEKAARDKQAQKERERQAGGFAGLAPLGPGAQLPPGLIRRVGGQEARVEQRKIANRQKRQAKIERQMARKQAREVRMRAEKMRRATRGQLRGQVIGRLAERPGALEGAQAIAPAAGRADKINELMVRQGIQGLSLQERQLVASGKLLRMVDVLIARMAATERQVARFEQQVNRAPNGAQQQFLPQGGR